MPEGKKQLDSAGSGSGAGSAGAAGSGKEAKESKDAASSESKSAKKSGKLSASERKSAKDGGKASKSGESAAGAGSGSGSGSGGGSLIAAYNAGVDRVLADSEVNELLAYHFELGRDVRWFMTVWVSHLRECPCACTVVVSVLHQLTCLLIGRAWRSAWCLSRGRSRRPAPSCEPFSAAGRDCASVLTKCIACWCCRGAIHHMTTDRNCESLRGEPRAGSLSLLDVLMIC